MSRIVFILKHFILIKSCVYSKNMLLMNIQNVRLHNENENSVITVGENCSINTKPGLNLVTSL